MSQALKIGDWIKVPKGTLVKKGWNNLAKSSKDLVVQITNITDIEKSDWIATRAPDEIKSEWVEMYKSIPDTNVYSGGDKAAYYNDQRAKLDAAKAAFFAKHLPGRDLREVHWEGKKSAMISDVELTTEPTEKPEVVLKAPTLRQQMIAKSVWKITKDIEVIGSIENPDWTKEIVRIRNEAEKLYPRSSSWHNDSWTKQQDYIEAEQAKITVARRIPQDLCRFKAGETFTVTGKFSTYYKPYHYSFELPKGMAEMWVPIEIERMGKKVKGMVPFGAFKDSIEADTIPTLEVYVIRDAETGKFYSGTTYLGVVNGTYQYANDYASSFMKAKQFDNVGRAKTSILSMTGYYEGLPGSENVPEWVEYGRGGKKEDFKSTWELVKFDKLARKEVEVIDLQNWFAKTWELRALTMKFGSAVRGLYKDIEKRDELNRYKGMLVFYKKDHDAWYGDKSAFSDEELAEIDEAVANAGLKKGEFRKNKAFDTVAVSFENASKAMMFKLSYNGTIPAQVINLDTMKEEVGAK